MGRPSVGIGSGLQIIFSLGFTLFNLNLVTTLCRKTSISMRANSFPAHILGPAPNGTNV